MQWHDIVGSAGAAFIVISYLLLQLQRVDAAGPGYSALNAFGAFLVLVSLAIDFNLSAFVVESFWLAISLFGLVRWARRASLGER